MAGALALRSVTAATLILATSAVVAQNAPPTFQADPEVYKTIFEDQSLRVIAATWKKGAHDKFHSHLVPSVVYSLNDCRFLVHTPDGTTRELLTKAGTAMTVPITPSHSAENVGLDDCRAIFVERK
jgi:hypothetical protein